METIDINNILSINLEKTGRNQLHIKGSFHRILPDDSLIHYEAADPATHGSSYSGSGMPFPNKEFAYSNRSNCGTVGLNDTYDGFDINILIPNTYYTSYMGHIQRPIITIKFRMNGKMLNKIIYLNKIDNRELTYNINRTGPEFYHIGWRQPNRTQESILYARGTSEYKLHKFSELEAKIRDDLYYNDKNGEQFFGLRPPA